MNLLPTSNKFKLVRFQHRSDNDTFERVSKLSGPVEYYSKVRELAMGQELAPVPAVASISKVENDHFGTHASHLL